MPSKAQIDRLGQRLKESDTPSGEDLASLQKYVLQYEEVRASVAHRLSTQTGLEASSRLKTTSTIIDKLRRENTRLTQMQDIAGVRFVLAAGQGIKAQDDLTSRICDLFPESQVKDRRLNPSFGYRAVHVLVKASGLRVEVQVRTFLQDLWAQAVERLADQWGRQIRYGDSPNEPNRPAAENVNRQQVVDALQVLTTQIGDMEALEQILEFARQQCGEAADLIAREESLTPETDESLNDWKARFLQHTERIEEYEQKHRALMDKIRMALSQLVNNLEELWQKGETLP